MQEAVIQYQGGWMGVSAVPGSGKTFTLSALAARLIVDGAIADDQEVLVVTLVNSAVDNFTTRIENIIRGYGLLPQMGYRVRTLHGLANDIVRRRPDLAGLSERFQIVDERESDLILRSATTAWLKANPEFISDFTEAGIDPYRNRKIREDWLKLAVDITGSFIRQAKDLRVNPQEIQKVLVDLDVQYPLLEMGCQVYADYQRALAYRSAVDFDDLIWLATNALLTDPTFLESLRYSWPYILEDEAQDSSRLQEVILRLLAGTNGNWVRVGDPNQAIFETFTTASPDYLRNFLLEPGVEALPLSNSGRSTHSIIRLANQLISWTNAHHPCEEVQNALTLPLIEPTPPGDPQPNPKDDPDAIFLYEKKLSPDQEINIVIRSLKKWLPDHQDQTVAILVPRNERGAKIVDQLKIHNIDYIELLRSTLSTRQSAKILADILRFLAEPINGSHLSTAYRSVRSKILEEGAEEWKAIVDAAAGLLAGCKNTEDYLWPQPGRDWLSLLHEQNQPETVLQELFQFRDPVQRWQQATLLPIDQLLLTISQELFTEPADLALAHKLALLLEATAQAHPDWYLEQFYRELEAIAHNQRKFLGFSEEDTGFDPDRHQGKVVVATVHKAKGLEWDRVYLMSVNNYDFPSAMPYDSYISERWFVRDKLNLLAETLSKLKALINKDPIGLHLEEGAATQQARFEYASERLRLLFVGITRARRELIVTWNSGRNSNRQEQQPAIPLVALQTFWKENKNVPTT